MEAPPEPPRGPTYGTQVMGALDPLTKKMVYVALSVTMNCTYCINSHSASAWAKALTDARSPN